MADLGNAWHNPTSAEPYRRAGMRDPVGRVVPGAALTLFVGNQFRGDGRPGTLAKDKSAIVFRHRRGEDRTEWHHAALRPASQGRANGECATTATCVSITKDHDVCAIADDHEVKTENDEYYAATILPGTFEAGDVVEYYARIEYTDRDVTWLRAQDGGSVVTATEEGARGRPFTFTVEPSAVRGEWGEAFPLRNVGVHAHVLADGRVLMWGRRDRPTQTINTHECTPFVWTPPGSAAADAMPAPEGEPTPQPTMADGRTKVNLFCSGHTFLPDGRLLVVGGHLFDGEGLYQATIYDPVENTWTATEVMNDGRWYPTATSLPDGDVLVLSGAVDTGSSMNAVPQVWRSGTWIEINGPGGQSLELYPRIHVASDGVLYMTGSLAATWSVDISLEHGTWRTIAGAGRINGRRDYCPSVMYDTDKIIYIGGGNAPQEEGFVPTAAAEIIDVGEAEPVWKPAKPMHFPRRHHNATILPDGTVLVTGGTRGGGGPGNGFNDLTRGKPVHVAELWDPARDEWTELAAEQFDRCYHATAVLLPDATVLSAGSGEYAPWPNSGEENFPEDNHRNGQIFSPPYLFKGPRPQITEAPGWVDYGDTFFVQTPQAGEIERVRWIRLSSVTHAFNMNQHIDVLRFEAGDGGLTVRAPDSPNVCPPGHYMLFILDANGVPSVAAVIRMRVPVRGDELYAASDVPDLVSASAPPEAETFMTTVARRDAVFAAATGTTVVVGLSGRCPYGIGACWGGAEEALRGLEGVAHVDPIPDAARSTAKVFLEDDRLPALERWDDQFHRIANGSYDLRGFEASVRGVVESRDGALFVAEQGARPPVRLAPLDHAQKVQWDERAGAPAHREADEVAAYEALAAATQGADGDRRMTVTGPLEETASGYRLQVREFSA